MGTSAGVRVLKQAVPDAGVQARSQRPLGLRLREPGCQRTALRILPLPPHHTSACHKNPAGLYCNELQSKDWLRAKGVAETSTRETKHHTQRGGELRFVTLVGPEELAVQALSPEPRDYRVFIDCSGQH